MLLWKDYLHATHLELIDRALMRVAEYVETGGARGIGRLAIFMPPRHGKSQTAARLFPAWFLGRNPTKRVILTGYAASLVDKHSRFTRNLIATDRYQDVFPGVALAEDSAARNSWDIALHEGGMDAMGINGAITGKGAHLLIIDDPVRGRQEAESALMRERTWDSYTNDLYTRLEPGGAVVLIMTRWNDDDLAGRMLRRTSGWKVIRLPALAEAGDLLKRPAGTALWAARYPAARLEEIRGDVGFYAFTALYQQAPKSREGALFKAGWIDDARVKQAKDLRRIVVAVDPAATSSSGSDETGIVVAGMAYKDRVSEGYILADGSLRGSPDAWARAAIGLYRKYKADAIVVETNQGGEMATNTLRTIDRNVRVVSVTAKRGKALRAEPVAALYEQGRVHHVGNFDKLEDQMCQWTPTDNTSPDRLDALVWALTELMLKQERQGVW